MNRFSVFRDLLIVISFLDVLHDLGLDAFLALLKWTAQAQVEKPCNCGEDC
jgi:hypothetical protein